MGKSYTGTPNAYQFNPTNQSPIDVRTVVDSYLSLFDTATWTVNGVAALYNGLPVFVCEAVGNSSALDDKSGLYVLTRKMALNSGSVVNCWEYLYDPDATEIQEPTGSGADFVPGRTTLGGWLKILSFPDLKFPEPDPDEPKEYVLKIYPNGTFNWEESTGGNGIPDPSDEDQPTYLTANWNTATQEFDISWTRVSQDEGNIPDPDRNGRLVLNVPDVTNPNTWSWVEEDTGKGIDIKGYPTQTDADGRWQPGPSESLVNKNVLSNSGEVIAVPVDSTEDNSEEGPNRPFKLMLNYDAIPPLTIYGGNSEPESDTCVFTADYRISGGPHVFYDYITGAVGSTIAYTPVQSRTVDGVTYTLNPNQGPYTWTLTGTSEDTHPFYVTAQAAWEPVVKYAVQPSFDNYDWDSKGQPTSPTVLTETAPQEVTQESAGNNSKYFYSPSGSITLVQLSTVTNRLRIEDENHITDLAKVDMWDGANNQWIELTQNTAISLTKTRATTPSALPSLSEWDFAATKAGTSQITPIEVTLRFKITKQ